MFAQAVVPLVVLATLAVVTLVSLDVPATSFRSPDEHANYLFTRTFAETGRLYYTAGYLESDEENLLHPRGVLTHEGRAVLFGYLGLPVLYAPAAQLLGEHVRYVAVPLALVTAAALAMAGGLLVPERRWLAWIAVLGATPLVYYLTRPFLNTLPALAFLTIGLYLLLGYYRAEPRVRRTYLLAGSSAFALAAFVRYEFAIFEAFFVAILLLQKHRMNLREAAADMALFAAVIGVLFVIPVLVLNTLTYGSPFKYGYGLFNEAYFPERSGSGSLPLSALTMARSVLLPAYPFDLGLALNGFTRHVIGVAPLFAVVTLLGIFRVLRSHAIPVGYVVAYVVLGGYIFLYRGAGYSWLADSSTPSLEASVVRYGAPLYVGFYLLAVYGLGQIRRSSVATALVAVLAVVGLLGALRDIDGNLLHVRTQVRVGDEQTRTRVLPNTEADAIIYTDVFDKTVGPYRDVAAWWGGVRGTHEGFFRPRDVARSISRVYADRPVYLYVFEEEFVVPQVDAALEPLGLQVAPTEVRRLYRVERLADVQLVTALP